MTYRDLNADKISYLLAKGTHEGELRRFFSESRTMLLLKKGRVQNLPVRRSDRIRVLCNRDRLPESTDGVVRDWFHKNITMADPMSVENVLSDLELYEQLGETIPDDMSSRLARSALVHLFQLDPSEELFEFLANRAGQEVATAEGMVEPLHQPSTGAATWQDDQLAKVDTSPADIADCTGLTFAHASTLLVGDEAEIGSISAAYTETQSRALRAALLVRQGKMSDAQADLATLTPGTPEYSLVERCLQQSRDSASDTVRSHAGLARGIRIVEPEGLTDLSGLEPFDIVGVCVKNLENLAFVRPLALVREGTPYALTQDLRSRLFPDSGDVLAHRATGRKLPIRGEIVRWIVEEKDTVAGKTRFHFVEDPGQIIEVIDVPFFSEEPDEIRQYIRDLMGRRFLVAPPYPIFLLEDEIAIAAPKSADPRREETYSVAWQAWTDLECWLLEGRVFSLGLPRTPARAIDLSPLDVAFRKAIRLLSDERRGSLTKSAINDLAAQIRAITSGEFGPRIGRIAAALDEVAFEAETIDSLIPVIVGRPEIQHRVEEIVQEQVAEKRKEQIGLTTEIEQLKKKNADLTRKGRELESQIQQRSKEIESSVRLAFDRAIADGATSLANALIFRQLGSGTDRTTGAREGQATNCDLIVELHPKAIDKEDAIARIASLCGQRRLALALVHLTSIARLAGVHIVLAGQEARQIARTLCRIDTSASGSVDIPMGLTANSWLRRALDSAGTKVESLAILDADLSPIEIYASFLVDAAYDAASGIGANDRHLIFACGGGDLALPIPGSLLRVSVVVQLDKQLQAVPRDIAEVEEDSVPLMRALFSKLIGHLEALPGGDRSAVGSVLVDAFLP
jgi:hypothetical protein